VRFQLAIMKMLSSYRGGKASIAELKRDLAIVATSGPDWTNRMKRLAARAPDLDAFSQGFLDRDGYGWWITPSGRAFLEELEKPRRREIDPIRPINAGDSRGFLVAAADMSRPKNFRPKILTIGTASLIFSSSETKGDRRTT
jgi:hypothetical protein